MALCHCLSGKLWYLQHKGVGDTIVYHKDSDVYSCNSLMCYPLDLKESTSELCIPIMQKICLKPQFHLLNIFAKASICYEIFLCDRLF